MNARVSSYLPILSLALGSSFCLAKEQANVIFVLVDDMGWGDLNLYHQQNHLKGPRIDTPALDALARQGVQLSRHYTAAPVSAPARGSLYSGMHQGQAAVVRNSNFDAPLEDNVTLASLMKSAGYSTALIGKWGIAGGMQMGGTPTTCPAWPTKRGFDYFFGYGNHRMGHRHYPYEDPHQDPENNCNAIWDGDKLITPQLAGCYSTDLYTARAKKWIVDHQKQNPEKPFFLMIAHTAPHARLALPAVAYPKGGGLKGGVQWLGESGKMINTANHETWDSYMYPRYAEEKWPLAAKRHASMITRVDESIGDLVTLLKDLDIDENTYIIFTSDNGAHDEFGAVPDGGEKHPIPSQDPSFFRSYGLSDGIKRDVWDGGLRVPCIVYAPSRTAKGIKNAHPSQFHDWMATFADIAGVPRPARTAGRSLLPLLQNEKSALKDNIVYTEFLGHGHMTQFPHYAANKKNRPRGEQQAFYFVSPQGQWLKAIRTGIKTGDLSEKFEVYDTLADPQETKNVVHLLGENAQQLLQDFYLRQRIPYSYVQESTAGKKSEYHYTGKRPYDGQAIPAVAFTPQAKPGLAGRKLAWSKDLGWVPDFSTLPNVKDAEAINQENTAAFDLPAGTVVEFSGYLHVTETGSYYPQLQLSEGGRGHIRLHNISLENTGPVVLQKGMHPITITFTQDQSQDGKAQIDWLMGEKGKGKAAETSYRLSYRTSN